MSEQDVQEYFKKGRDESWAAAVKDQNEYDRQLLALSSAFLAVSLAFIKDVVPLNEAHFLPLFYSATVLFGCCVLTVLFSLQFAKRTNMKIFDYFDKQISGYSDPAFPSLQANLLNWLNWTSGALFGAGVVLLITFVILNIHREVQLP